MLLIRELTRQYNITINISIYTMQYNINYMKLLIENKYCIYFIKKYLKIFYYYKYFLN